MFAVFCIFLFTFSLRVIAANSGDKVVVVVVEYSPITKANTPEALLNVNARKYIQILDDVNRIQKVDVIVFPEGTLDAGREGPLLSYAILYDVNPKHIPCLSANIQEPQILRELSCAARKHRTILVINFIWVRTTLTYCSTDMVIDVSGKLHRWCSKDNRLGEWDLYNDPISLSMPLATKFQLPNKKISTTFCATSIVLGFRFSYTKILVPDDLTQYVVSSNWISELPFLTSLQVHQMWAQEFNVSLYFAGANKPDMGKGGTGIYHKSEGPMLMNILAKGGSKAYMYEFGVLQNGSSSPGEVLTQVDNPSTDELGRDMDEFFLFQDKEMERFGGVVLNTSQTYTNLRICDNRVGEKFCCDFKIRISVDGNVTGSYRYTYQLVIFKGSKYYHGIFEPGGVEVCGIVACVNSTITSCGTRIPGYHRIVWPITFEEIEIKSYFAPPYKEKVYYSSQFPNSLLSSIRPIHPSETSWTRRIVNVDNQQRLERVFSLKKPQNRILTFAIFSRNFTLVDPFHRYKNSCNNRQLSKFCMLVIIISLLILQN